MSDPEQDTQENQNLFLSQNNRVEDYRDMPEEDDWKPPRYHSYETMMLHVKENTLRKARPAGFRSNGKPRKIKTTCLISRIKNKCRMKNQNPKLAVCITMYNEDEDELKRTLSGVIHNYNEMRLDPDLNFKKEDFIVFLVCDGFERIPASFRKYASSKNFFDLDTLVEKGFMEQVDGQYKMKQMSGIMDKNAEKHPTNVLHMFQVQAWDFGLPEDELKGRRVNFVFAVKQRNDGKINSHKWFFQGLCKYLKPDLCMMLDIGTQPEKHSIYKLYKYMIKHKQCGGCCGEIEVDFSDSKMELGSFLIRAAQYFEYKTGHAPDKANESFFGFNTVLPGAYSMFRWEAIKGEPLDEFFRGVNTTDKLPSCAEANEFLAEDRIMCLQIYIKKSEKFHLSYIPDAKAKTDAPGSLAILIKQRRRWMNGATFGSTKVMSNFVNMVSCKRTKHSWYRQVGMVFFLIYYILQFTSQFFTVGSMYASISVFLKQSFKSMLVASGYDYQTITVLTSLFDYIYIFLVLMAIIISLTTPVDRGASYFKFLMVAFGSLLVITMIGIVAYLIKTGFWPAVSESKDGGYSWTPVEGEYYFSILTLSGVIMMGVFIIPMILRPLDFLSNFRLYMIGLFSYIFMMPTFINVMAIYSMCNLHDISWGNRPTNAGGQGMEALSSSALEQEKLKQEYQLFRAHMVYMWLCLNALYGGLSATISTTNTSTVQDGSIGFIEGFSLFIAGLVVFKFLFGLIYTLKWNFRVWTNSYYGKSKYDVALEFKNIRKNKEKFESSDEEDSLDIQESHIQSIKMKGSRPVSLMLKSQNRLIDDSDNDDSDFDDPDEEETKDNFQTQSQMRKSTRLMKFQQTEMFRHGAGNNNNDDTAEGLIVDVEEYDHNDPNFDPTRISSRQNLRSRAPTAGILKSQSTVQSQMQQMSSYYGQKQVQQQHSEKEESGNHKSVRFVKASNEYVDKNGNRRKVSVNDEDEL